MCDGNGNKVLLKITDNGITIAQQKYGQTTVIDPESGKVKTSQNSTAFIELTSETVFELPTPRSRTTIGVGESVKVTANTAVTWEINGNHLISQSSETSTELTFTARDVAGSITITAKNECDNESITFSVIEPENLEYITNSSTTIHHTKDWFDLIIFPKIEVLPTNVNFGNVEVRELNNKTIDSGIFNNGKDHYHIPVLDSNGNFVPYGEWTGFNYDQNFGKHNISIGYDKVGAHESEPPSHYLPLTQNSSVVVDIDVEWKVTSSQKIHKLKNKIHQEFILDINGNLTSSKGSMSKTLHYTHPSLP